jgi:hypothetical protein
MLRMLPTRTSAVFVHRHPAARPKVQPLIAQILGCEAWYNDDQPSWKGAPSYDQALRSRLSYIKRLRRFADQFPSANTLAATLDACAPHHRCMSGACPECSCAFQRWFVHSTDRLIQDPDSQGELVTASIVFPKGRASVDAMDKLDTLNSKRTVTRAIENSPDVQWMVGGIDLSLNDDSQKNLGIAWQLQLYCVALIKDRTEIASLLKSKIPGSKHVIRPVQTKACDGSLEAISYAFKTEFIQRIAYQATTTKNGKSRKYWTTRKVSLRPVDHVQALLWLDSIGLAQRLYLLGVRMTMTSNGVALVKLRKQE